MEKLKRFSPYIVILLVTIAAYGGSLDNKFALDDLIQIVHNRFLILDDFGWSTLTKPAFPGNLYRPLTFFSYYLQVAISGFEPAPFHLGNLALHFLVSSLVFILAERVFKMRSALIVALLFSVHPLFVEVVANVSGRAELLSALFVLLGLCVAGSSSSRLLASKLLVVFFAAFLSASAKESGLVLSALLPLVFCLQGRKLLKGEISLMAASLAGASFYMALRLVALNGDIYSPITIAAQDNPLASLPLLERGVYGLELLGNYLSKIFFPLPLNADYTTLGSQIFGHSVWLSSGLAMLVLLLFLLSLAGAVIKSRTSALLLWFFLAFLLTANILFPIGTIFAERLVYLPSIGILSFICLAIEGLFEKFFCRLVFLAAILLISFVTRSHVPHWRSTSSLASYQEAVSPASFRTQLLLAERDREANDFEGAKRHLKASLQLSPENDDAYYQWGVILLKEHDLSGSEEALKRALSINADYLPALHLYARLLLNQERSVEARQIAEQALRIDSQDPDGLLVLMALALKGSDIPTALDYERKLIAQNYSEPDFLQLRMHLKKVIINTQPK